MHKRIFVHF